MKKLSIVIPTFNEEKYLPKLLNSIKTQTFKDYEIIISDAHSKDKTRGIARKFKCKIVDGGLPAVGRNKGARVARGKYLLFLDADVVLSPNFITEALSEFERRKLDIAFCNPLPLENTITNRMFLKFYDGFNFVAQFIKPFGGGYCILVKKHLNEKLNGFDENIRYLEDADYLQRAAKIGKFRILKPKYWLSMRRYISEGWLNTTLKYIVIYLKRIFGSELKAKAYYRFDYKK